MAVYLSILFIILQIIIAAILSNATVRIYAGNNLLKTYNVPMNEIGTVWHVFDITENGIETVNEFYNESVATGVR